jgi:chromosome segregation ATPase
MKIIFLLMFFLLTNCAGETIRNIKVNNLSIREYTTSQSCDSGTHHSIYLIGEINDDSVAILEKVLSSMPECIKNNRRIVPSIYLKSKGGYLSDGFKVGELFSRYSVQTIIGDGDESLATQFAKIKNQMSEQTEKLSKIQTALGGDSETSLLTQIQKLRAEQGEYAKLTSTNSTFIVETMNKNNEIIRTKFDEFTKLLTENNTKALVEAMEKVITDFNTQMNELIQRLVKENFEELNNSVKNLNEWQKENKEQIAILISQFNQTTSNLETSSKNILEISTNTKSLTDNNSILQKMITELQKVMIEDKKFTELSNKLQLATNNIENSSTQLADHMKKEKGFQESINQLLDKLKEIEQIKDINSKFWRDIETRMNDGVNIIAKSNDKLSKDVEKLDSEFKKRLSESFMSLDKVLQAMVLEYQKKTTEIFNELKN